MPDTRNKDVKLVNNSERAWLDQVSRSKPGREMGERGREQNEIS